ncbi:MAG: RdgB/HAM1 family non-canonical purine NTP pyrophosphatase [Pseudomonadota bacterium]
MTPKRTLVLATHNTHKIEEIKGVIGDRDLNIVSSADLNVPEPEETGSTFLENALIKARFVAQFTGHLVLADDSGMCADALNGDPGVRTADWAETPDGTRDYAMAMAKVHAALLSKNAPRPWKANFNATMVLASPTGEFAVFVGVCDGQLVWPPRGTINFGFDPMFVPDGSDQTFSELSQEEKARYSHRGIALRQLIAGWPDFAL